MTTHPGSITYVDADAKSEQTMPITKVPESLRFVKNEKGVEVPVVRVVATVAGKQRFIKEYGPGNEFLRETIQQGG